MTPVFVDTSAFVALVIEGDDKHARAKKALKALSKRSTPLVTTSDVFDEAVTFLRYRTSHAVAVGFGERLRASSWCRVMTVDDGLRGAAWAEFVRFADQRFSFTDCTSFATMRAMELREVFGFDEDFRVAGFAMLPMK